mmetsp:Transcript_44512/g.95609  ORF Transcript_44512/g.95609 Transcript_44512/m.95609 type:complete len:245 (+) Transcript_44512:493-1227(+)
MRPPLLLLLAAWALPWLLLLLLPLLSELKPVLLVLGSMPASDELEAPSAGGCQERRGGGLPGSCCCCCWWCCCCCTGCSRGVAARSSLLEILVGFGRIADAAPPFAAERNQVGGLPVGEAGNAIISTEPAARGALTCLCTSSMFNKPLGRLPTGDGSASGISARVGRPPAASCIEAADILLLGLRELPAAAPGGAPTEAPVAWGEIGDMLRSACGGTLAEPNRPRGAKSGEAGASLSTTSGHDA